MLLQLIASFRGFTDIFPYYNNQNQKITEQEGFCGHKWCNAIKNAHTTRT